jgi:subtilisin family serine protease
MKKTSAVVGLVAGVVAVTAWPVVARAQAEPGAALGATNGLTSQRYLGTGKGVIVAVLDSGVDVKHPSLAGALYSQKDFTGEKILDDSIRGPGHGTGIAGIMVGRGGQYTGLAPAARLINARVDDSQDVATDLWAGSGLIWSAKKGARVANVSFGSRLDSGGQLTERFTLVCDYVAERYGVNVTVAGGNDGNRDGSSVNQVPADNYNGYTVGAVGANYVNAADFSNYAQPEDRRTKPDLMAPGVGVVAPLANWERRGDDHGPMTGTSFAAPMVGGVLAQMVGYGKAKELPTNPLLLKAVLLTTATKALDTDGTPWEPRKGKEDKYYKRVISKPLDNEQGAGMLDAVAAYRLYSRTKSRSTPVNVWKEGALAGNKSSEMKLGKLAAGQRVDATLTWYRHVTYKDRGEEGFDDDDTLESGSLADFTLRLLRDGEPVVASDSSADNLEHLSWTLDEAGSYSLQVYRFKEGGIASEKFAVAARVLKDSAASLSLVRQAGVSRSLDEGAFGIAGAFGASAVPEPGVGGAIAFCATGALARRRRRRG